MNLVLSIIGDKRNLRIINALIFDDLHEFRDFLTIQKNLSTSILTNRLKKMLDQDIFWVIQHPDSKKRKLYYLTEKWMWLIDVLVEIRLRNQTISNDDRKNLIDKIRRKVLEWNRINIYT